MTTELSRAAARKAASSQRRPFLRGVGACVALPSFASLRIDRLWADAPAAAGLATTATGAPLRTAFVYFPNGAIPATWWPTARGPISSSSARSSRWKPLKDQIQVLGGSTTRRPRPGRTAPATTPAATARS